MATTSIKRSEPLSIPATCVCPHCGATSQIQFTVEASATAILSGAPWGRRERAEKEVQEKLLSDKAWWIQKVYDDRDSSPHNFVRYFWDATCASCGNAFPWRETTARIIKENGLWARDFKKLLAGAKVKKARQQISDTLDALPPEQLPALTMEREQLLQALGLSGVPAEPGGQESVLGQLGIVNRFE